jgi:hypothetical protein
MPTRHSKRAGVAFLFSVSSRVNVNAFVFIFFPDHFPEIFYCQLAMATRPRPQFTEM